MCYHKGAAILFSGAPRMSMSRQKKLQQTPPKTCGLQGKSVRCLPDDNNATYLAYTGYRRRYIEPTKL